MSTFSAGTLDYGTPSDHTAVVGPRIVAWIIDLIVYLALLAAFNAVAGGVNMVTYDDLTFESAQSLCDDWQANNDGFCSTTNQADGTYSATTIEGAPGGLLFWTGHLVVYALIQGLTGGSVGKLALGLRVVDKDGQVAGIGKSFLRTIAWIVDGLVCGLPLIGGVAMVSAKGHRRVGDLLAGTYVVKKSSVGVPPVSDVVAMPSGSWGGAPPAPGWGAPTGGPWSPPNPSVSGPPVGGPPVAGQSAGSPFGSPSFGGGPSFGGSAADGPTWDPARNTYIQYDRDRGQWLEWDEDNRIWVPISQ